MPLNETWITQGMEVITNSDFGFLGNLLPLILVLGISWALSKKPRDVLYVQFPITLGMKLLFPFFHTSFLILSFALFIMNLIGSKGDLLADAKNIPIIAKDIGSGVKKVGKTFAKWGKAKSEEAGFRESGFPKMRK